MKWTFRTVDSVKRKIRKLVFRSRDQELTSENDLAYFPGENGRTDVGFWWRSGDGRQWPAASSPEKLCVSASERKGLRDCISRVPGHVPAVMQYTELFQVNVLSRMQQLPFLIVLN